MKMLIEVGNVCEDEDGIVGIVAKIQTFISREPNSPICYEYGGGTLDGHSWFSNNPIFLATDMNSYIKEA